MENISGENFVLVGAILLFVAVLAGKVASRFGAPALLVFLGVGILFGLNFISFHSVGTTQFVGMIALCIILFSGGMGTKLSQIRPIVAPGIVLATVGVLLTAVFVAGFVYYLVQWFGAYLPFTHALLLASTMASTDSASVFSILRSKKQGLRENLGPLLELESGSNDPMAYILTILLIGVIVKDGGDVSMASASMLFVVEMVVGAVMGYLLGRFAVWIINRININNSSLYSILLLACAFFTFAFTDLLHGNGYLAVYLAGLVVGNRRMAHKNEMMGFFDSFTWLLQIVMFLTLGLFVNLPELLQSDVVLMGCIVGGFMIIVARPAAVFISLAPFRKFSMKARVFVSWVGLRGAVPIIFAMYPLVAGVEGSNLLFNIVFFVTIISLLVQGTTVNWMASALGLSYAEKESSFNPSRQDTMSSVMTEVEVNETMLVGGNLLRNIILPAHTLVMMVCRDGDYFVPQGDTELIVGDKLLVISDRFEELEKRYKDMGIDDVMKVGER